MKSPVFLLCAFVMVSACAPDPGEAVPDNTPAVEEGASEDEQGPGDIELCDAGDYRHLMGSNIAAVTLEAGPMLRVFSVNDIVTQEYIPQRTNIVFDTEGSISRVWCG